MPDINHTQRIHDAYVEYNRTLRAWYVGFGIAAPVLIATQDKLYEAVSESEYGFSLTLCFFGGVSFQVLTAVVNKWMNWYRYEMASGRPAKPAFAGRLAEWYRQAYTIHLLADVATSILYFASVAILMTILFPQ